MSSTEVRSARAVDAGGILAAIGLASGLLLVGWVRHRNGWSGHDLAIFDQAAWQIAHGRAHISIIERHVLADHFSPILYLLAQGYRVVESPAWLLAAQSIALGVTILPMRAIARHVGVPASWATVLVACSAPLIAAGLFDFHPGTLAVPFVAAAVLGAVTDRPALATAAAIGVGLCRADLAPVVLAVVIVATPRVRWYLAGVTVGLLVVSTVLPARFGDTNDIWASWFAHLGDSPVDAALHPWRAAAQLGEQLGVLGFWVAAAGVAIVCRPRWLVAVLVAGAPVLLSRWEGTGLPWYHYGAPIAPIAIAGTLHGLAEARLHATGWQQLLARRWWVAVVLVLALASPFAPSAPDSNRVWNVTTGDGGRDVSGAAALVEDDEAVSAEQRVLAHLSQRERAYVYPVPFGEAPGLFPIGAQPDPDDYPSDAVDVVIAPVGYEDLVPDGFEVVARPDGFVVLRRVDT